MHWSLVFPAQTPIICDYPSNFLNHPSRVISLSGSAGSATYFCEISAMGILSALPGDTFRMRFVCCWISEVSLFTMPVVTVLVYF